MRNSTPGSLCESPGPQRVCGFKFDRVLGLGFLFEVCRDARVSSAVGFSFFEGFISLRVCAFEDFERAG